MNVVFESDKLRRAAKWFCSWEGFLVWAFIPYALSLGPFFWSWYGAIFELRSAWWLGAYVPLQVQIWLCPIYGDLLDWYLHWWITS